MMDFSSTTFVREVSRARTFGFMKDIESLQKNNLAAFNKKLIEIIDIKY